MSYFKRKIDCYLEEWRADANRKPLIIKGARQVGKTESIRHFIKENYKNSIEINFIESPQFRSILDGGYSAEAVVRNISRIEPRFGFAPNETVLFFDEIQSYPDITTTLKFFALDGRFDVICSGSLLGINYKQIESISVGYKTDYEMCSMDFEEFLWARGYDEDIRDELLLNMTEQLPFSDVVMETFRGLFLDYVVVGGMPAVVTQYFKDRNFSGTLGLQRQILSAYKEDIRKYATGADQTRISRVFEAVPVQLAKENKKFQLSQLASGARFHDYAGCIEWLRDAGLINLCYCLHFPELPLRGNYDDTKFKIYLADTGLLVASLDDEAQEDLRVDRNLGVYKGGLYENIAGEALYKSGCGLYYYKREDGTLEEDFFVRDRESLVPVEVKARSGRSQSLRSLINNDRYADVRYGIKLTAGNIGFENNIYTFPHFCAFLLKEWVRGR